MITLTNENCFDLLPRIESDSVDLICIDPPYEISRKTGYTNTKLNKYKTLTYEFGEWDHTETDMEIVIKESFRILKPSGTFICFYDLWKITILKELLDKYKFKQLRFIEWIKTNPVPVNSKLNYLTNCREIAVTAVKGSKPTFHSEYDNGIYKYMICRDEGRFHPTQKPLELIKQIILKHTNENDLVLDCFSGSGTTAAACKELNRNFIGCELDKTYYDKSIQRLSN